MFLILGELQHADDCEKTGTHGSMYEFSHYAIQHQDCPYSQIDILRSNVHSVLLIALIIGNVGLPIKRMI